jgi:hypothetical protein
MQITHEEARRLIQFNADEVLNMQERITLSTHLKDCIECRAYADEIKEVESILLPVMQRQWNLQPLPLSIDAIRAKRSSRTPTSIILTTRTAAIGVVFLAFIFSVWQFALSSGPKLNPAPIGVPPIPTPSTQSTSTKVTFQACEDRLYTVQEIDTLDSIAYKFSTSKEEIMAANSMKSEAVRATTELVIPICNFTPTGTINPAIVATTYTPSKRATTTTPDG